MEIRAANKALLKKLQAQELGVWLLILKHNVECENTCAHTEIHCIYFSTFHVKHEICLGAFSLFNLYQTSHLAKARF